nr:hypothetical protein [Paraburkholderia sp. BL8N3]
MRHTIRRLTRYRAHYGLAALPYPHEPTPLLLPIGRLRKPMTRGGVHLIVKQVFENVVAHLALTGEPRERAAEIQYLHADDDDRHRATESGLKLNR